MTREEHVNAEKELLNDQGVARIIQTAELLPVSDDNGDGWREMAPLRVPLQIFGRDGRGDTRIVGIDVDDEDKRGLKRKRRSTAGGTGKVKRAKGIASLVSGDGAGSVFG
jgi:hypothetical protein